MLHALDLAKAIDARSLTPATLVSQISETIRAQDNQLKCFAHLDLDRLRIAAAQYSVGQNGLFGLPVAIKDIIDTVDYPTEYGFSGFEGYRPHLDAAIVARIRDTGGLIAGKTATCPFAFLDPAPTRNPRNPNHTPGGSSAWLHLQPQ